MKYVVIVTRAYENRNNCHDPRIIKYQFLHLSTAHSFIRSIKEEVSHGKVTIDIKRERV